MRQWTLLGVGMLAGIVLGLGLLAASWTFMYGVRPPFTAYGSGEVAPGSAWPGAYGPMGGMMGRGRMSGMMGWPGAATRAASLLAS